MHLQKRFLVDRIATGIFYLISIATMGVIALLLFQIILHGYPHVNWQFLSQLSRTMEPGGGIRAQLFDSFYLLVLTMLFLLPVGLGAAIYVCEYATHRPAVAAIRTAAEVLASTPSVVMGLFGMLVFVTEFRLGFSILSGALTLALLNLPVILRLYEDAIAAVPQSLREASYSLGAGKWETIRKVVLRAARPRLIAGALQASGRVFGEAAALIFTAGMSAPPLNWRDFNPASPWSPLNPFRPAETLAVHLWKINSESLVPDARRIADGTALILVLAAFSLNVIAGWIASAFERELKGE